jgi:prolyl-tRNA editing enzyme YbaK/EbsC (Cys-tRNA(Pro) deacylase)
MPAMKVGIPRIDPNVQYVGVSKLRQLNATNLHDLDKTLVIQDNDQPLAVIVSYEIFLEMQKERERVLTTLQMLMNDKESEALLAGLEESRDNNTQTLANVREALKKDESL